MRIAVLGAGAWGTALACSAASAHEVILWARDPAQAESLQRDRANPRYLPGVVLPPGLGATASHDAAVDWVQRAGDEGLLIVATPMGALRERLQALPDDLPVLWLCKGFEAGSGALGHEIASGLRPAAPSGVLSGPSFAQEVAQGQPTALVAASHDAALLERAVAAFHGDALRVYRSADPVGVEVGGAVKNVMAIACGILDGLAERPLPPGAPATLRPGLNARAALITRGLAEMTRLGVALGADPATFMGLSGLGDLVLTATGGLSRNRQVGLGLAAGRTLPDVLQALGHVAEGVYSARTVLQRARAADVDMPITEAVVAVLDGALSPWQAVGRLMSRQATSE